MTYDDYVKGAVGSVIGFALAQAVNLAKVGREWWRRPKLHIEFYNTDAQTLRHHVDAGHDIVEEIVYGFTIRNSGRSMAEGVEVYLIEYKIERGGRLILGENALRSLRWDDAPSGEEFRGKSFFLERPLKSI